MASQVVFTTACQGISICTWPGTTTLITPAQVHINVQLESSEGILPSSMVGAPGIQGEAVAGMQGMGVNTPSAAAVAAATVGLAMLMHMPKGMIFTSGM